MTPRDKLTNAIIDFPETQTEAIIPRPKLCTRLGKCKYCPLIKNYQDVTCGFTKTTYQHLNLPKHITCEINNIIYLISCNKCNTMYVGETCREFRQRMYEHRHSVLNPKPNKSTPVSGHFTSDKHKIVNMEFSVLEWCTPKFGTAAGRSTCHGARAVDAGRLRCLPTR